MKEKKPSKMVQTTKADKARPEMDAGGDEDGALWSLVTKDVARLGPANKVGKTTATRRARAKRPAADQMSGQITLESFAAVVPIGPIQTHRVSSFQLDGNLQKKFSNGELPFDGKIDLHGLTLDKAHHQFMQFITRKIAEGARCILVITGKGSTDTENGRGVLRKNLPMWCEDRSLKTHILQFTKAQPRHGGGGAFYILLRKQR